MINSSTGVISGTPTAITAAALDTITATNAGGSTTTTLSITVNDQAPANLTYTLNPAVYTVATLITANSPTTTGGTPTSYSITPALPAGLAFSTTTGVITGTPTAITAAASYTVKATNVTGSAQTTLSITVNDRAPATLTYTLNPAVYKVAMLITANSPTTTGGTPTSYSISPALPAGLAFSTTTGVISGTPTAVSAAANYTVKATNVTGSAQTTLSITVLTNVVAPSNLTYSNPAPVFTKGVAITALSPTSQGGTPTSYTISATPPTGLVLNTTTGVLSGTPTALQVMTPYQITAANAADSTSFTLEITVVDVAPTGLAYSIPTASYPVGMAITNNTPSAQGGAIVSYSVNPALPSGTELELHNRRHLGHSVYCHFGGKVCTVVTGMNTGGKASATLSITVTAAPAPKPSATPSPTPSSTPAFFVATNGSDTNAGTLAAPFASLAAAQTAMRASSSIKVTYLRAGNYLGAVNLTVLDSGETWMTYPGDPAQSAILGSGTSSAPFQIANASNITIANLTFDGSAAGGVSTYAAAIWVTGGVSKLHIQGNLFQNNVSQSDLYVFNSDEIYFQGNTSGPNEYQPVSGHVTDGTVHSSVYITDNTLSGFSRMGIELQGNSGAFQDIHVDRNVHWPFRHQYSDILRDRR